MKDNFEIVLDDLRLHPDSRISAIIRRLDIGKSSIKYALYRLVQIGKVKKLKYGPSDFGYSEVSEVSMPIKDVPGYRKEKIRFEARFREFTDSVIPMIRTMPGRPSFFYAELLGQGTQTTVNGLKKLEKIGVLFKDKRRRKNMKNPLTLWWIAGEQPADLAGYKATPDIIDRPSKEICIKKIIEDFVSRPIGVKPIDEDDMAWMKEARRTRRQRLADELIKYEKVMPIPSYDDYFRANGG